MASKQASGLSTKPSFAKVAAMAPSNPPKRPQAVQQSVAPSPATERFTSISQPASVMLAKPEAVSLNQDTLSVHNDEKMRVLPENIGGLALIDSTPHEGVANGRDHEGRRTDSTEDDQSHISNSSTKPPSLDNKSIASVTTFAMDEKESLRPDDSASVQAAEEEESLTNQAVGNGIPQIGSETGLSSSHKHPRNVPNGMSVPVRRFQMANPPQFGDMPPDLPGVILQSEKMEQTAGPNFMVPVVETPSVTVSPDDKLLEAMGTPKDRLLLLQIEQKILAFITQTKDEFYDLPPQNSFGRLLAHKLADYYNLAHYITNDNNAVRLYRTQCSRLPVPLGVLASSISGNSAPLAGPAAVRIMRRRLGAGKASAVASTAGSSSVPSKTTSEAGADAAGEEGVMSPNAATSTRDKSNMTREEKEAYYQAARDRIFKDFPESNTSENTSAGEASASLSRSSSSSGKKKSRKQRAPKDDSFEARSQFVPGYPGMTFSNTHPPFSHSASNSFYSQTTTDQSGNLTNGVGYGDIPARSYPQFETPLNYSNLPSYPVGLPQQYGSNDGWSNPQSPQPGSYFNFGTINQAPPSYSQHLPAMPSQSMSHYPTPASNYHTNGQNWAQPSYPAIQQMPAMIPSPAAMHWPNYTPQAVGGGSPPYPFGQLPPQAYPLTPAQNNQHPIPGSFNRSVFNPQTRSFVPGGPSIRPGGKAGTQKIASHISTQTASADMGILVRADAPRKPSQILSRFSQTSTSGSSLPMSQQDSIQKKWGTPAHLPKKPPPSQVPSTFVMDTAPSLPSQQIYQPLSNNAAHVSPLIVTGGAASFSGA